MSQSAKTNRMRKLITSFHNSDQSLQAFADAHGLSRDQMYYWIKKFSKGAGSEPGVPTSFIPLQMQELEQSTPKFITIRTSDGIEIQIPL